MSLTSFGDLVTIGIGVLDPALPIDAPNLNCVLRKVSVANKDADQHYLWALVFNLSLLLFTGQMADW